MKTILMIEVKTPDNPQVHEDCDKQPEDYSKKELKTFRDKFAKGFHQEFIKYIKKQLVDDLEEGFFDSYLMDDYSIEGWESFEDYNIEIKVTNK